VEDDEGLLTDAEDAPPRHERTPSRDDSRLAPGTEVAGYLIDEEIGKGGMGNVYSATHRMIGKRAAIKVLKPDVSRSPIVVERFIQEARAVNQIHHPNIIDIFAFGALEDGRAYHIMDLLLGESLRKRLKRGPLIPSEAASVIEETALALTAAHEKGFVHRDLKPDNIFLQTREDRWPEVKLLDFGLAKLMPEAGFAPFKTKTGVMLGTPEYMSPEQARGTGVDYRTDIYALGVVMFEIMAGRRPFISQGDPFATLMMHAEELPPSLDEYVSGLPTEMVQLVATMLAKDPAARPSLAAVRTVIKRLRTTQLPGRTLALELSQSRKPQPEVMPAESIGDISASRLGADSILPGDSKPLPALPSTVTGARHLSQPPIRPPSHPPQNQPRVIESSPAIQLPVGAYPPAEYTNKSTALGASIPPVNNPYSIPPVNNSYPGVSAHASMPPTPSHSGASMPPTSLASISSGGSLPPTPVGSLYPPAQSTHGARSNALSSKGHAGTEVGVPPAPMSRPLDGSVPKKSHLWIIIGAVVAIAAGIAIALILVGS
jgi:serine/threonine protein kinase